MQFQLSDTVKEVFKRFDLPLDCGLIAVQLALAGLCARALCHPELFTEDEINALKNDGKQLFEVNDL